MKLTAFPKTIICLALLLGWGSCAPPATAQQGWGPWEVVVISALPQTVIVETPRDSDTANFESVAMVYPNVAASGFLTLSDEVSATRHSGGVNMLFSDGSVRFLHNGDVAGVLLRGRTVEGDPVVVMITPAATEDCLIYTTIGTDVHATWEAEGRLTVIR
jgi:prepilin-type processing-associated H-X9-DG protein